MSETVSSTAVPRKSNIAALALYLLISVVLFGLPALPDFATAHVGFTADPAMMMWYLAWWPHAIRNHLNPFITHAVWPRSGYNMTWVTSMPAIAIPLAPVTVMFGAVAAYNVAALLAPAFSAWAGFLLCRRLTGKFGSAFAGGLIYGFSPFQTVHIIGGHLIVTSAFIPPLCVFLVLRLADEEIGTLKFAIALAIALAVQCLISSEVLATMTVFGAAAMLLAWVTLTAQRRRLAAAAIPIASAYLIATIILLPFLYYAFVKGSPPRQPVFPASFFAADLLSFVVPGQLMLLSRLGTENLASNFTGNLVENGSYFSIPLLALAAFWLWRRRHEPGAQFLAAILLAVLVCTLGPVLQVNGRQLIPLPWAIASRLPLIEHALPVRFSGYAFLILAVIVSIALSDPATPYKKALMAVILVCIFPNPAFLVHQSRYDIPEFFAKGLYRHFLAPGENVLVLPYGWNGPSAAWQAQADMYFSMPGAYLAPASKEDFRTWPLWFTLTNSIPIPDPGPQLKAFAAAYGVNAIVVAGGASEAERSLTASLGVDPVEAGGVLLYRLTQLPNRDTAAELTAFQRNAVGEWFVEMLCTAKQFLDTGHDLADLNPKKLRSLGMMPDAVWGADLALVSASSGNTGSALWVGPGPDGTIAVGLPAWSPAAQWVISRYGRDASKIFYPYPAQYTGVPPKDESPHFLMMMMQRSALRYCRPDSAKWWTGRTG